MLSIRLEREDLSKVHFRLSPQLELIGSIGALQERSRHRAIEDWRTWAGGQLSSGARILFELVQPGPGFVPGFLVPSLSGDHGLRSLRRDLLNVDPARVMLDMADLGGAPQRWLRRLARADPAALAHLAEQLHGYYLTCLAPVMRDVGLELHQEFAGRAERLLLGGLEDALSELTAKVRWEPPYLVVDTDYDMDVVLDGRGLCLVPSLFWSRPALCLTEFDIPTLVYPVPPSQDVVAERRNPAALANLIGRTRASVLVALRAGCGTTELARRAEISKASASEHVAALRDSGLVSTVRRGKSVHHQLTPFGRQLLRQAG